MHNYKRIFLLIITGYFWCGIQFTYAQQSNLGLFINKSPITIGALTGFSQPAHPVVDALPIFGKSLRNEGHNIPLPFGVGITSFYYKQKFIASSLTLTSVSPINGDTIHAWADTLIQDTQAGEVQMIIKPNVWLLPFLNIYGIFGYTSGTVNPNLTVPRVVVDFPGIGEQTIDSTVAITDKILYNGPIYGIGATVSIGIRSFFFLADYHYSETYPNDFNGKFIYNVFSPKAGVIFSFSNKVQINLWTGAMYFSNKQIMHGEVKVSDISEVLANLIGDDANYEGNIAPLYTWNMLAGTVIEVNKHHFFLIEGGFIHRTQLKVGYEFRF